MEASPITTSPPVVAPPASVPDVDLLDFGCVDTVASALAPASNVEDIFGTMTLEPTLSTAPVETVPLVETVSEKESAIPSTARTAPVDPFAAEGLLGDLSETPLNGFGMTTSNFEYKGSVMAPLMLTTAQFGSQWGKCPVTSPFSIISRKVGSLDSFMKECESVVYIP